MGDPILRTRAPLSLELGPGILNNIFDGIQRPLALIQTLSKDGVFIDKGITCNSLCKLERAATTASSTAADWPLPPPPGRGGTALWSRVRGAPRHDDPNQGLDVTATLT